MDDTTKAVETSVAGNEGFSLTMGDTTEASHSDGNATSTEPTGKPIEEEDVTRGTDKQVEPEDADDQDDTQDEGDLEDLGDFDPENSKPWDERYFPEGQMNKDLLSKEFFDNKAKGVEGLNEATYNYLEQTKGISKGVVKEIEAALVTQNDTASAKADGALFEVAGGADNLKAALDWGKGGGYSEAQQKAFNAATGSSDPDTRRDAVELLMSRFNAANPQKAEDEPKPQVPKRDATKGTARPSTPKPAQPFKNRTEYRQAVAEAGDNQQAQQEVARRLLASSF
jgi:hypothetical protein